MTRDLQKKKEMHSWRDGERLGSEDGIRGEERKREKGRERETDKGLKLRKRRIEVLQKEGK